MEGYHYFYKGTLFIKHSEHPNNTGINVYWISDEGYMTEVDIFNVYDISSYGQFKQICIKHYEEVME